SDPSSTTTTTTANSVSVKINITPQLATMGFNSTILLDLVINDITDPEDIEEWLLDNFNMTTQHTLLLASILADAIYSIQVDVEAENVIVTGSSSLNGGAIAGIVIGSVAFVAIA